MVDKIVNFVCSEIKVSAIIIPDVKSVRIILDHIKSRVIGKDLGNIELQQIFNSQLGKYGISFAPGFGESGDPDLAACGIVQAWTADTGLIMIEYNDYFWETFNDDSKWKIFVNSVSSVVGHELIHREQINKIRNKSKDSYNFEKILQKMQKVPELSETYLSAPHELMTFAFEAVEQFRNQGYSDKQILERVKKPFAKNIYPAETESHIFWTYTDYFDTGDTILKKFLGYMSRYLKP